MSETPSPPERGADGLLTQSVAQTLGGETEEDLE